MKTMTLSPKKIVLLVFICLLSFIAFYRAVKAMAQGYETDNNNLFESWNLAASDLLTTNSINMRSGGDSNAATPAAISSETEAMDTADKTAIREEENKALKNVAAESVNFRLTSPVDSNIASLSPVPLAAEGKCIAGKKYLITSVGDLFRQVADLECIFAAGVEPGAGEVPLGFNYGYMLAAANTAFWNNIINLGYQGDFVVRTQCNKRYYNIGWLSIAGANLGTAVWYVGKFPYSSVLADGEYPLEKKRNIVMDFTVDFKKLCPIEGNESPIGLKGFSPFNNSIFPINNFVDIGTIVGRDKSDGGLILLNKAYIVSGNKARTVLFYATKNFDPNVAPNFAKYDSEKITVPKGPLGESVIHYRRKAIDGIVEELIQANLKKLPFLPLMSVDAVRSIADIGTKAYLPLLLSFLTPSIENFSNLTHPIFTSMPSLNPFEHFSNNGKIFAIQDDTQNSCTDGVCQGEIPILSSGTQNLIANKNNDCTDGSCKGDVSFLSSTIPNDDTNDKVNSNNNFIEDKKDFCIDDSCKT